MNTTRKKRLAAIAAVIEKRFPGEGGMSEIVIYDPESGETVRKTRMPSGDPRTVTLPDNGRDPAAADGQ